MANDTSKYEIYMGFDVQIFKTEVARTVKTFYSNPSKLANFGGTKIGDREFGNRELGCYFISKKSIWGFSATK